MIILNSKLKKIIFILMLAFFIELFICNFQAIRYRITENCNTEELSLDSAFLGAGIVRLENGQYKIVDEEESFIEFAGLDRDVSSVYIDVEKVDGEEISSYNHVVQLYFKVIDEGHAISYKIKNGDEKYAIVPKVEQSHWIETCFYGKVKDFQIFFDMDENDIIEIRSIRINQPKGIHIQIIRMIIMFWIMIFFCVFRPVSKFYQYKLIEKRKFYHWIIIATIAVSTLFLIYGIFSIHNTVKEKSQKERYQIYSKLAESFSQGKLYLNHEAEPFLLQMENPYDTELRKQYEEEYQQSYLYDAAYYKGKYYAYFGVMPVLLFHLPYYILTGNDLPDYIPSIILAVGIMIGFFHLFYSVCRRFFQGVSFCTYWLTCLTVGGASGVFYLSTAPRMYELAILMGLFWAVWGLDFWCNAIDEQTKKVNERCLFFGSLFIAFIAASRPTLFSVFFASFVLFASFIFVDGELTIKKNIKNIIIFSVPFIIVASGVMSYNYARFGSVFDFGAMYNLTNNDLTHRGFQLGRTSDGIWKYFFRPLDVSNKFPFVYNGGIFPMYPITLVMLYVVLHRKITNRKMKNLSIVFVLMSIIVAIANTNLGGTDFRYSFDFTWMLLFVCAVSIFSMENNFEIQYKVNKDRGKLLFYREVVVLLLVITLMNVILIRFDGSIVNYKEACPVLFYRLKYVFEIWS